MTDPRLPFQPSELGLPEPGGHGSADHEVRAAAAEARRLEDAIAGPAPTVPPDLSDRVMAAIQREPAHRAGILAALRRRPNPAGLVESLRIAWARAGRVGSPIGFRASAVAYVAAVLVLGMSLTGAAAYATAGALGLFGPAQSSQPDATHVISSPAPLVTPEPSEEPGESPEPSASAEPGETEAPSTHQPRATDDGSGDGETAGPGDGEGGVGSADPSETSTPRPSATPKATETPHPTSSASD
jgi:hypothetical protein